MQQFLLLGNHQSLKKRCLQNTGNQFCILIQKHGKDLLLRIRLFGYYLMKEFAGCPKIVEFLLFGIEN